MANGPENPKENQKKQDHSAPEASGGGRLSWLQGLVRGTADPLDEDFQSILEDKGSIDAQKGLIDKNLDRALADEKQAQKFLKHTRRWLETREWNQSPLIKRALFESAAELGRTYEA